MINTPKVLLTVAPMEGLTGWVFRQVHSRLFGGADAYYIPFVTPTVQPAFTARQMRELAPEANEGLMAIPQLLTRREEDFLWATKSLLSMGYKEVNLNLGCPAGTVVAKGKGAGFLREPFALERFLAHVLDDVPASAISLKTRVGWSEEKEFESIFDVYEHFPVKSLIIHPRLKTDQYKGSPRLSLFDWAYQRAPMPLGYNGDLVTVDDIRAKQVAYPKLEQIMVGRALIADPALFRKAKGGEAASKAELQEFDQVLFEAYARAFESENNALMRRKEYWFYLLSLFDGVEKLGKALFKAKTRQDFERGLQAIFADGDVREHAKHAWYKPL